MKPPPRRRAAAAGRPRADPDGLLPQWLSFLRVGEAFGGPGDRDLSGAFLSLLAGLSRSPRSDWDWRKKRRAAQHSSPPQDSSVPKGKPPR